MTLFLAGCGKEPQRVTLPAQLYTYDYPLTTIAADRYGYWTGGEDGELCLVEGNHRQFYQTSLDRIYDILRDHRDSTLLWIASRNAGLQQWRLDGTTLTCQARYPVSGKGLTYSVYGKTYCDINLVYQSTDQLRGLKMLDLNNPPQIFPLSLKGYQKNADGLYTLEDMNKCFMTAIRAYDKIEDEL